MLFRVLVVCVVLGVAVLAAGKATHSSYTLVAWAWFADNPFLYFTHEADGWYVVKGVPIEGIYARLIAGDAPVSGDLSLETYGILSVDGADGNFHGPVNLSIEDMDCSGQFRSKRVNFFETGSWVLQCPDGSKIHDTWQFEYKEEPSWPVVGDGMLLIPHG